VHKAFLPPSLLLLAALILSSCASGFNRRWDTAATSLSTSPRTNAIAGRWEGTWESRKNGHTGVLKCVVSPQGGRNYLFDYYAEWGPGFKSTFEIECEATPIAGGYAVSGSKKLPISGTYTHEGMIRNGVFEAEFASKRKNVGSFRMRRVGK
jgi:hypothetical protein